jgi:hypothetical protein
MNLAAYPLLLSIFHSSPNIAAAANARSDGATLTRPTPQSKPTAGLLQLIRLTSYRSYLSSSKNTSFFASTIGYPKNVILNSAPPYQ